MLPRLLLLLALAGLIGCSAESPFSVYGKAKLAAERCGSGNACPEQARP
ncbi:MAG: hypothetical protein ABR599_02805 [Gemmatimonadota bacterium]